MTPPPNLSNPAAEAVVVGSLLRVQDEGTMNSLRPSDFSLPDLGAAFATIAAMYREGETITPVTVAHRAKGDPAELDALLGSAPPNAAAEAKIVADTAILRGVWEAGAEAQRIAITTANPDTALVALQDVVEQARQQVASSDTLVSLWDAQRQLLANINAEHAKPIEQRKMPLLTGWKPWDDVLDGGMVLGDKIMIGGRPGTMKSTIIQQIAYANAAPGVDRGSLIVAAEMLPQQYAARGMSSETGMSARRIMSKWMSSGQVEALNKTPPEPDLVLVSHTKDINQIVADFWRAKSRLERRGSDLGFLAIDYIQAVHWYGQRWSSRKEELDAILDRLESLSDHCPVVVVSSINREGISSDRPKIEHAAATDKMGFIASLFYILWKDGMNIPRWWAGKIRDGTPGPEGVIRTEGNRIVAMA